MNRIDYKTLITYFGVFVICQFPILNKFIFANNAFGFIYIGFLLLLPRGLNPFLKITAGFVLGLIIDTFSNTPGLHAFACTFTMFVRDYWYLITLGEPEDDPNINIFSIGLTRIVSSFTPLIAFHLLLIFAIEHGQFSGFSKVISKTVLSTVFSLMVILIVDFAVAKRNIRS